MQKSLVTLSQPHSQLVEDWTQESEVLDFVCFTPRVTSFLLYLAAAWIIQVTLKRLPEKLLKFIFYIPITLGLFRDIIM